MENERAVGPSTGSFHLGKTSLTEHSSAHNNTHPTFIKYRVKTKKIVHYISLFHCWSLDVIIWHQQDRLCRLYNQVWWQFPEDLLWAETRTIYVFAVHQTTTTMAIKQTNSGRKSDKPNQISINLINKMFATYIWSPSHNLCNHWASPTQSAALLNHAGLFHVPGPFSNLT